jgi:hypothetical protein
MYGLVGLTGGSLHYLAEDFGNWLRGVTTPPAAHATYHRHGPGGHWHLHRHDGAAHEHRSTALEPVGNSVCEHVDWHAEHECPLLTVVANMKLGFAPAYAICVASAASVEFVGERVARWTPTLSFSEFARGPPLSFTA